MIVRVKQFAQYATHSTTSKGIVNLTVKSSYSNLSQTIKLLQMLNNDITLKAKVGRNKPFVIGTFRIKDIVVDGDGESKIKFTSILDYVNASRITDLIMIDEDIKEFVLMSECNIEEEEGESEENES